MNKKEGNESMSEQLSFEFQNRTPIKGYPELRWTGKRPYTSTQYYPAQLRERYGEEKNGWLNKIFWGDNLQVMSHLLKDFRGMVDLIYIDPPFDSKADYKMSIALRGTKVATDSSVFEEKQYGDIWTNDEYLQFMYERLIMLRELLSDEGSIYLHCDYHKVAHLRLVMDEVFGPERFVNEIIWSYATGGASKNSFAQKHDNILFYSKTPNYLFNQQKEKAYTKSKGRRPGVVNYGAGLAEFFEDENGVYNWVNMRSVWDVSYINSQADERTSYPTQKPEELLERIIKASSNEDSIVFDCFMGSGTAQAVAMRLGRRFIGADINLGAIQTTTKRLLSLASKMERVESIGLPEENLTRKSTSGFEVYNVNNYDFFRNPLEARDLIIEALGIQPYSQSDIWDGELDGRMVKIMPINRIASKADLEELKANLPYKAYQKRKEQNPAQPVESITIICMGHEPDLKASFEQELSGYKLDVQIVDILRDKKELQLKRTAEVEILREDEHLVIRSFYPMNLMQKLSLQREYVENWRQLVESVMIDWNFDGAVMKPTVMDVPDKGELVKGIYVIPGSVGTIKVKITDLISESLEVEVL